MRTLVTAAAAALVAGSLTATASASPDKHDQGGPTVIGNYKHLVVIYEENHSFDNLYGMWGSAGGQQVDGLSSADQLHTTQVAQNGDAYGCLLQDDVNLTSPTPLPTTCVDSAHGVAASQFTNDPFTIDNYIAATDTTCPVPGGVFAPNGVLKGSGLPGGCTRDLVHRFYQEQYQLNGGLQNRYVTGSDAVGLTMGQYDTRGLPIYQYLHGRHAPNYVIADHFFQGSFGGSFLNHQYLVAARAPIDTAAGPGGADAALHSVVDSNGFPNASYPLYHPATAVKDAQLTQACGPDANPNVACGDYAVNTIQPSNAPFGSGAKLPLIDDTQYPNIGDELSAKDVSWNWYAGGWNDAAAGHPGPLFQYHHQPLNYFANYAPGQPGRAHLKDETDFVASAKKGTLPTVSFVKPYGEENEHPGYASEPTAATTSSTCSRRSCPARRPATRSWWSPTMSSAGSGTTSRPPVRAARRRVCDSFGPGTRIPTLILSKSLQRSGVDHTVYDTTSILATIEHGLGLAPLSTRDAAVADLHNALRVGRG